MAGTGGSAAVFSLFNPGHSRLASSSARQGSWHEVRVGGDMTSDGGGTHLRDEFGGGGGVGISFTSAASTSGKLGLMVWRDAALSPSTGKDGETVVVHGFDVDHTLIKPKSKLRCVARPRTPCAVVELRGYLAAALTGICLTCAVWNRL
jgi:hypothetical protein